MRELQALRDRLLRRAKAEAEVIADGSAQDYPSYMKMVGIRDGILLALREMEDIESEIEKLDKEA